MTSSSQDSTTRGVSDVDAVTQRVLELTERVISQARRNGLEFLEGYERVLKNLLDLEE